MNICHTFATSLAQDGKCILWAITAKKGMIYIGADVSNAFAEAKIPDNYTFYIQPD
jgi:hypothetical protein